jgi:hypothetical protein
MPREVQSARGTETTLETANGFDWNALVAGLITNAPYIVSAATGNKGGAYYDPYAAAAPPPAKSVSPLIWIGAGLAVVVALFFIIRKK